MHAAPSPIPVASRDDAPRADVVTASDLVRNFGLWQDRAALAPVYITFRGRARLVLSSVDVIEALVAPHLPEHETPGPDADALLDLIRDMVIIADADLRITHASRTARAYFAEHAAPGLSAGSIVPAAARQTLLRALQHVQRSGAAQAVDLPSPRQTGRLLTITLEPHRRGVAMLVQDISG